MLGCGALEVSRLSCIVAAGRGRSAAPPPPRSPPSADRRTSSSSSPTTSASATSAPTAASPARTPNIDALAASGVALHAGLRHRAGVQPVARRAHDRPLPAALRPRVQPRRHRARPERERSARRSTERLFPQYLKERGYATGMVGKWHLGPTPPQHPMARGFDEFFGFVHGANLYYLDRPASPASTTSPRRPVKGKEKTEQNPINPILRGREPVDEPEYLTEAFTREAVSFIERHRAEPFFLYVAYNAPHTPLKVTDKRYDRFPEIKDEAHRIYAAMVSRARRRRRRDRRRARARRSAREHAGRLRQRQRLRHLHRAPAPTATSSAASSPCSRAACGCRSSPRGRGRSRPGASSTRRSRRSTCCRPRSSSRAPRRRPTRARRQEPGAAPARRGEDARPRRAGLAQRHQLGGADGTGS